MNLINELNISKMTPIEKANEIFNKMYNVDDIMGNYPMCFDTAKKCALISVDYVIESAPINPNNTDWDDCGGTHKYYHDAQRSESLQFWNEVKKEIKEIQQYK